jgi:hypothetical protein
MDPELQCIYIKCLQHENNIKIEFVNYIKDVLLDDTKIIIPFTNNKYYNTLEIISFKIFSEFEKNKINAEINIKDLNININYKNESEKSIILIIINNIIDNIINRKFSLTL